MKTNKIKVCYIDSNRNWGDYLNSPLCSAISGREVQKISPKVNDKTFRNYCIGSRLDFVLCKNYEVWGAGFMYKDSKVKYKPNKIHAVRGKLSRDIFLKNKIDCPEIYGDPALLYSLFYKPNKTNKKYKIGIIPHYIDKKLSWIKNIKNKDVVVIDILSNTREFIDKIHECEVIFSSTLHGIIASDSYNIPCYWVKFSENVAGDGFKFYDYFSSVNRNEKEVFIRNFNDLNALYKNIHKYEINFDPQPLFDACPFKKCSYKEFINNKDKI